MLIAVVVPYFVGLRWIERRYAIDMSASVFFIPVAGYAGWFAYNLLAGRDGDGAAFWQDGLGLIVCSGALLLMVAHGRKKRHAYLEQMAIKATYGDVAVICDADARYRAHLVEKFGRAHVQETLGLNDVDMERIEEVASTDKERAEHGRRPNR